MAEVVDTSDKYGFFTSKPQEGPYQPEHSDYNAACDNPFVDLQKMGCKMHFEDVSIIDDNFKVELKIDGISRIFQIEAKGRKKAHKLASLEALTYLSDPTNIPSDLKLKFHMNPLYQPQSYGQTAQEDYSTEFEAPHEDSSLLGILPFNQSRKKGKQLEVDTSGPFFILTNKYPDTKFSFEISCTAHVDGKDFIAKIPGKNSHMCRMFSAAEALAKLENMEFPDVEKRKNNILNPRDTSDDEKHPITILYKEFSFNGVFFSEFSKNKDFYLSINRSEQGGPLIFSCPAASTKRESKYIVAMKAIKELNLDSKYPAIITFVPKTKTNGKRTRNEALGDQIDETSQELPASTAVDSIVKDDNSSQFAATEDSNQSYDTQNHGIQLEEPAVIKRFKPTDENIEEPSESLVIEHTETPQKEISENPANIYQTNSELSEAQKETAETAETEKVYSSESVEVVSKTTTDSSTIGNDNFKGRLGRQTTPQSQKRMALSIDKDSLPQNTTSMYDKNFSSYRGAGINRGYNQRPQFRNDMYKGRHRGGRRGW